MPNVVLTERAENDLETIFEYYQGILGANPAFGVVNSILGAFDQLMQFPGSGRPSVVPDTRELVLTRYPFIAPYRLEDGQIQVLRILHQRAEQPENW
ncbi:type II toxin-antitoxin system RelE/ParE family toxin [Pseudomonas gozinkensis]|uniref:type II toxin-antitoxin system RelE/ParE family toxin n=1 Tax=Pseudomonas gozinkensis TaxID=2774461 RepID=UPI00178829BE|nr:type II toxin-antitoxin system RelE/ParE family toxin [Pseudomonas gozinkensis]